MTKYKEYKGLSLPELDKDILQRWKQNNTFKKSIESRNGKPSFVFYEGPPSANGMPGIHHVMARALKDIFCRYKTLKGFQVERKAGWDTHGLPIELSVEKSLGITKEDIGKKISVEDYNKACRKEVMKYTDIWNDLTEKMGYWVDMENPYITYDNKYIETVWWLLSQIYQKGLLYKGYTIQPYSPAAGTGLSSHELNQPGCYRDVKDTSVTAQFKLTDESISRLQLATSLPVYVLAWTTTPWTLPSNVALAAGSEIDYVVIETYNSYTHAPIAVIMAKALTGKYFNEKNAELSLQDYKPGDKQIPFKIIKELKGKELKDLQYQQLLPYAQPEGNAFRIVNADFVTTEDGTGIVHIAPSFGADDFKTAKDNQIGALTLVNTQGKFTEQVIDFAGEYVKEQYLTDQEKASEVERFKTYSGNDEFHRLVAEIVKKSNTYLSVDERITLKLKLENKAFKIEKYEHSYPHCWRTDKPVIYYPLDSWFIKIPEVKSVLIENNKKINWKPESTGTGRFGNWLENANDWNLSRSRFWGIPLPIWRDEDGNEICISSVEMLKNECDKSVKAGFMKVNPFENFVPGNMSTENYETFDLHKPYADEIILVSVSGKPMKRESDLIDVWFDSGAMPYAQYHYPFENKELIDSGKSFPADFIAEGVDQTRGWFYTLHAIAGLVFNDIAYKNVVSNGLVLDKNGQKMSKRLGNAVDPFTTIEKYGADAVRWYMISNAQPWENLKFDIDAITETQRKFFNTLHNTYSFFCIYANIDGFNYSEPEIEFAKRPEIDRWILSELQTLLIETDKCYNDYEPMKAARAMEYFLDEYLSNWYVRLCRRRFWKGEYNDDKISAYQTLYQCLETLSQLIAPIAPFFAERLFSDLNQVTGRFPESSVHLSYLADPKTEYIDKELEERMEMAQQFTSMVLSLRKKSKIKVRQPLQKIMIPVLNQSIESQLEAVKHLLLSELNVKELEFLHETGGVITKKIKPNFKTLGPKFGKYMKAIGAETAKFDQHTISEIEKNKGIQLTIDNEVLMLDISDFEITSEDIPGWLVANEGAYTVALDITITPELKNEGYAREFVNRIQNIRKDKNFDVTDKIVVKVEKLASIEQALSPNLNYICSEILANKVHFIENQLLANYEEIEIDEDVMLKVSVEKVV